MSLFINQGVHAPQTFEPIIQENATLQIAKLALNPNRVNTLNVTFRILNGPNKGRQVTDSVCYDPKEKVSFRYLRLREAAGHPYEEGESQKIDIEALLLNAVVHANLSAREYRTEKGEQRKAQQVDYIGGVPDAPAPAKASASEKASVSDASEAIDLTDEELPFEGAPSSESPEQSAPISVSALVDDEEWE